MDDQKQMGILIEQGRWMAKEIGELKSDVKQLLSWRWKIYGANVVISAIVGGGFAVFIEIIRR